MNSFAGGSQTSLKENEIKAAEQRGYSKGYVAGRKRLEADLRAEDAYKEKCEFHDRAFLVALPSVLNNSWSRGDKPATSVADRMLVAWDIARAAVKSRRFP